MKNADPCSWLLLRKHSEWAVSLAYPSCTYRLSDKIMKVWGNAFNLCLKLLKAWGRTNDLQNGLHIQWEQTVRTEDRRAFKRLRGRD